MKSGEKYNSITNWFIILLFGVLLILTIFAGVFGSTFAWLTDNTQEDGETIVGRVGIEIYSGDNKLNGTYADDESYVEGRPMAVSLGQINEPVDINLTVRNTGNIPGIVRCFVVVTDVEQSNEHSINFESVLNNTQVSLAHDNWEVLYSNSLLSGDYYYDIYLNSQLAGGKSANITKQVTPINDNFVNKNVYIYVRAEIVAYSGNAYQLDSVSHDVPVEDKPFGDLSELFLLRWKAWQ